MSNSQNGRPLANKTVVLIQPAEPFGPMAEIPLSLIGLAAILREGGADVRIIDARLDDLSIHEALAEIGKSPVDLIGITGLNNAFRFIKDLCHESKRTLPSVPIMAGGAFIASIPEIILSRVPIDVACTGEGDDIIVELARRLMEKESLAGLANIAFMRDRQCMTTQIQVVMDFDHLPLPAYDLLDMPRYVQADHITHWNTFYFPITAGRGCVHHCYYCGRLSHKVRRPSPEKVLSHLKLLSETYGIQSFLFSEDSGFYPKQWVIDFCNLLVTAKSHYRFALAGCPEQLDEDLVTCLARAGCTQIDVAVEHWNPDIQKGFFRVKQSQSIIKAWKLFRKYGISNNGFNILWGHPRDTPASFTHTYNHSVKLVHAFDIPHFWMATLVIYPNSRLYRDAMKRRKILDYEDYMYALHGYGPYINLTNSPDDEYTRVVGDYQFYNAIEEFMESLRCRLPGVLLKKLARIFSRALLSLPPGLLISIGIYLILKNILRLPLSGLDSMREKLNAKTTQVMYNPNRNYYRELACLPEVLSLPPESRFGFFDTGTLTRDTIAKIFNSAREARAQLYCFIDKDPTEKKFEGVQWISIGQIVNMQIDYILIPAGHSQNHELQTALQASPFVPKLITIKIPGEKPVTENRISLTGSYYNMKFYQFTEKEGKAVRTRTR